MQPMRIMLILVVVLTVASATSAADIKFQPIGGAKYSHGLEGIDQGKSWNTFFFGTSIPGISNDSTRKVYAVYRSTTLNGKAEDGGSGGQIIAAFRSFLSRRGWWIADIGFIQDIAYGTEGFRGSGLSFGMGYAHEVAKGFYPGVYVERILRGVDGYSTNIMIGFTLYAPFSVKVGTTK